MLTIILNLQLVTRLRMLEKGSSQVEWRLRGSIAAAPIDVALSSTFVLDLITGRVKEHREEWDLSRSVVSLP